MAGPKRWLICALGVVALFVVAVRWGPCPDVRATPLPTSLTVTDASGGVLRQVLASDGSDCRPVVRIDRESWIAQAVVAAEDKRFWRHHGVDPLALLRAVGQNLRGGRVISGASTLSTLVIRLTHGPCKRTLLVKVREYFQALQIDARLAKDEILTCYLNRAPFGGNVVGIQAASRRYFDKDWHDLSLTEASLLAGLPQAPSRLRPDRHPAGAAKRRVYVLGRMQVLGMISETEYAAARAAPVVCKRQVMPFKAPHAVFTALLAPALSTAVRDGRVVTTIAPAVQAAAEAALQEQIAEIGCTRVSAGAIMVLRVRDGAVLALVGSPDYDNNAHAGQVNGALARRSPGSALKPFLYAAAFDGGLLTAGTVVDDHASVFGATVPVNFDGRFRGGVTAGEALALSLNIPAYRIARDLGSERFLRVLRTAGLDTLDADATYYGLALALGGCEVRLWDLVAAYGALASGGMTVAPHLLQPLATDTLLGRRLFSAEACWLVNEALGGKLGHASKVGLRAACKTGTSSGMRDAWCIVWNPELVVGVWLGNADGHGDAALVGATAAAPLAIRVFRQTESGRGTDHWFQRPGGLETYEVCTKSGREAAAGCATRVSDWRIAGVTRRHVCDRCTAGERGMRAPVSDRPVIVQPTRGMVLKQSEWLGEETVVPLQSAAGSGGRVFWFVNGEPAGEAARGETVLWRPRGFTGRTIVTCAAASAASDQVAFQIE